MTTFLNTLIRLILIILGIMAIYVLAGFEPTYTCGYEEPEQIEITIIGVK